jgi:uncharacterized protein
LLIHVRVTPNAKEARVTKLSESDFEVKVDEKAENGKANKRLLEILSIYFDIPKSRISVIKGNKSRDKVVEVLF